MNAIFLNKYRNGVLTLFFSLSIIATQAQTNNAILQVPDTLSEEQLMTWKNTLPTDGWFILRFKDAGDRLLNYSNKDYEMSLWLKCKAGGQPGYLIEYSNHYGDGDYGGIDFIGSRNDNGNKVRFMLDGKDFGNPFSKGNPGLAAFTAALKKAMQLTVSVYNKEMNPETGKEEEKLNRSVDFKLAHGELLEMPVSCEG